MNGPLAGYQESAEALVRIVSRVRRVPIVYPFRVYVGKMGKTDIEMFLLERPQMRLHYWNVYRPSITYDRDAAGPGVKKANEMLVEGIMGLADHGANAFEFQTIVDDVADELASHWAGGNAEAFQHSRAPQVPTIETAESISGTLVLRAAIRVDMRSITDSLNVQE